MKWINPDYTNCGLNVVSSISRAFGCPLEIPTHPAADELIRQKEYRNIVFMLFDGMGVDLLEKVLPADAFLRRQLLMPISTVYPSTTTNVTTSLECGMMPRNHAWLGWTLYFPQIEKPVDIFTNLSDGEAAADYNVADRFIPRDPIFPRITAAGIAEATCVSRFGDTPIDTLDELFDTTLSLCRDEKRRYIYTYWGEPDHTMHNKGCYDPEIFTIVQDIDKRVEKLCESLPPDTLLFVTADHGLIDARHHYVEDMPKLHQMLRHYPTMETRAASFHVKPEFLEVFPACFREHFGENFLLLTRDEFIQQYLGSGPIRPQVYDFVGDYMALATDLDCVDGSHGDHELIGVHAGLTEQEMIVPLIVYQK